MYQMCCLLQFRRHEVNLSGHMGSRARPDFQGERCGTGAGGWQAPARRGEEIIGEQLYLAIACFSLHLHPASTPLRRDSL
jgi:hypothetical protein